MFFLNVSHALNFKIMQITINQTDSSKHLSRLWLFLLQALFLGMLVVPTTLKLPRGFILTIIVSMAIAALVKMWRVHQDILLLWASTIVVGAFGILWGVINDAPGALSVATVYLVWPTLYLIFIGMAHDLTIIRQLENTLLLGIILSTIVVLTVFVTGLLGFGHHIYPMLNFLGAGFGKYEGFTEFRIFSLTTVMYGLPFVVSLLMVHRHELTRYQKSALWLLIMLLVVISIGSGRRMFLLLLILSPVIALFFVQLSALRLQAVPMFRLLITLGVVATGLAAWLVMVFDFQVMVLVNNFVAAFQGHEASSAARFEQATALWRAFENSPLVGLGLGASVDVVRSHDMPWAYELSYLALLMNVGLVGFFIYAGAVLWVALKGIQLSRKNVEFAMLFVPLNAALCAFLIMNATNPYLAKFDYLWVIFLPLALINAYLTQRPKYA